MLYRDHDHRVPWRCAFHPENQGRLIFFIPIAFIPIPVFIHSQKNINSNNNSKILLYRNTIIRSSAGIVDEG